MLAHCLRLGSRHHLLRCRRISRHHAVPVRRHLGDVGILAEPAFEIAAHRGDGKGSAAGHQVEKRFFLNRVVTGSDQAPVYPCLQNAIPVFPHPADSPFAAADYAHMAAQPASDPLVLQGFVEPGFHLGGVLSFRGFFRPWVPFARKQNFLI
jgi:hypothetical protein